jgi:hypothetical protein
MKFVINAGIDPTQHITELALMKLAVAIRATVGFSKKVVFKMMREMKNGALWICYSVDGHKCSTFVKAANFARLLNLASVELGQIKSDYCKALKVKFPKIGISLDSNIINLAIPTDSGYITYYITEGNNNVWGLYTRKGQSAPRKRFTSLPAMIAELLSNPIR